MQGLLGQKGATKLLSIYYSIRKELAEIDKLYNEIISSGHDSRIIKLISDYSGKKLRAALFILLKKGHTRREEFTERDATCAAVIELIHTATLLHDDVLDDTLVRRCKDSFKAVHGNEQSVIAGDFLFSRSLSEISRFNNVELVSDFAEACEAVCLGEMEQLRNRNNLRLTRDEYIHIITGKTATLFELAARWSCEKPALQTAYSNLGRTLGVLFQIVDDWLDVTGDESKVGKSLRQDLTKGKMTLPLIMLREKTGLKPVEELFTKFSQNEISLSKVTDMLYEYKIEDDLNEVVSSYEDDANRLLKSLELTVESRNTISKLVGFFRERTL